MVRWLLAAAWLAAAMAGPLPHEVDSEQTRKLLGSSVVTSVSVIMDHGNGTKTYLTDKQPAEKRPQVVGTPGTLLAPDRYEFYSFGEDGELVKKLMTLDQIQSLIASGDDLDPLPAYDPQPLADSSQNEGVHKVLESVQNVLKGELQAAKVHPKVPMPLPDDSWSILLPGLLNSDLDFKDAHISTKNDVSSVASVSNDLQPTKTPPSTTSHKRPTPTTTQTTTTIEQEVTSPSTMLQTEMSTTQKSTTEVKYSTQHNTPAPVIKTTVGNIPNKTQKPLSTTKRPYVTTKKPYTSEAAAAKIPQSNPTKTETTTKTTTTAKRPVISEERNPSTKNPETKKPIPEKKKPSGIPTITHYLPLSSSSMPPNSTHKPTTPTSEESTTAKHRVTSTTREPLRITTTKRPFTSQTTHQKYTHTTTKKPTTFNNKPSTNYQKITTNTYKPTPPRTTQKLPRPTTATPTLVTKHQNKITPTIQTTSPTTTKNKIQPTTTMKVDTEEPSTIYQMINTTTKEPPLPKPQKLTQEKKPEPPKPSSNLIGQSSNIINTKLKPSSITTTAPTTPTVQTENPTTPIVTTSTQPPERLTTFSYSSKLTPSGDIVTSTVPSLTTKQNNLEYKNTTSGTSTTATNNATNHVTTTLSTTAKWNNTTIFKTTEKPMQKITLTNQHSVAQYQSNKGQTPSPSSYKPTTYHPQNFNNSSRKPIIQNESSTTNSIITKTSPAIQSQKLTTTVPPTTVSKVSTSSSTTHIHSTSFSSITPTTQGTTKPVTDSTPDSSTLSMSTIATNVYPSDTTLADSTSFSTEEMPLQEIPLKLYESLKDSLNGPQDIMTTIIAENMQTTTGKIESTYATTNAEDPSGSTLPTGSDRLTTIMTSTVGISTTPPSKIKMNITNTSENQNETTVSKESINSALKEPLQESASMPIEQKQNVTIVNNTVPSITTTVPATDSTPEQSNSETTTPVDSTTIYKDQILQEGISAVTSILLDETQRQQAIKEAILASSLKDGQINQTEKPTTTENEPTTTTDYVEQHTLKQENDKEQMKSEVRLNEDAELPEKLTSETPETTTIHEKPNTTMKDIPKENINENIKQIMKKNEPKPSLVLPTKESKLNPDSNIGLDINKKKPEVMHMTEGSIMLRTTGAPDFLSTTERLKISDFEKSVPKPSFGKKPNPVFQPLESLQPPAAIELHPAPYESMGLEASIAFLGEDVRRFADLCNELAFRMWTSITGKGQIASRSLVMSPFAVTSLLAMVFLGARGPTSGQMNDVLRLDDMVTFNPHQVLQNVTESVINSKNHGVATAAFVRQLYSDKSKGKILDFYKERVQQYYQGHVEEVNFAIVGDIIRRRTNLLVKRQTLGKVQEYLRGSSLNMRPPLAAFSANIFQTDCDQGSTDGRDGEMYFVVRPSTRQRRLVPVPAVVWRTGFLAGYEPSLDATSVCLGADSVVSTILILPGQQGQVAPGDGLARLEQRLIETSYRRGGWSRLLRSLMPRPGLELQIPRFSHRSVLNITGALQRMGLRDLFNTRADLRGLNGLSNDLHLSDMLQVNTFSTCGEETIGARHHVETYPASPQRMGRDDPEYYPPKDFENAFGDLPLSVRPRQARLPDNPRLRFDRPFLYMVRHNPSGMLLHMGRFNPRLLP